jgi:mannose-1-phosphate guanylyltransferase
VRAAFLAAVKRALEVSRHAPAGIALLGADADSPVRDLGWILPKDHAAAPEADLDLVESFVEKPPTTQATELFQKGGLWNTLIVVGSVEALWRQARRRMPRQAALFNDFVQALASDGGHPNAQTDELLARCYKSMAPADFRCAVSTLTAAASCRRPKAWVWSD